MKRKNWFWGILFLLLATLLVVGQFGLLGSFGFWSIVTLVVLAIVLIYSLVRLQMFGVTMSLAFAYMVLQHPLHLYILSPWILIATGVLAGIGLSLLIRPRHRHIYTSQNTGYPPNYNYIPPVASDNGTEDENHPYARVQFGALTKYLHGQQLESCRFEVNLGSLEVYFGSSTPLPSGCNASIDCSLGSITIYLSPDWQVIDNTSASLGSVNSSPKGAYSSTSPTKTLYLNGNVSLGSVEIKYI